MRRIARGRSEKALEELADLGDEDFAAAVHAARKDLKKLRAVLRLVRDELGRKTFHAENRRYRDAGRLLSRSRDAEVKLQTMAALSERFGAELPAAASREWGGALERERDRLARASGGEIEQKVARAGAEIGEGRDRISRWSLETDSWELIEAGLVKSYRRGRQEMRRARRNPSAENVHRWRKRAKDVWYQLRLISDAWPALLGETVNQAHELADLLGDHHDLAILRDDLAHHRELDRREKFEALIERRQKELLDQALELGNRFYAEKPKAFGRRIEAYWEAWRRA